MDLIDLIKNNKAEENGVEENKMEMADKNEHARFKRAERFFHMIDKMNKEKISLTNPKNPREFVEQQKQIREESKKMEAIDTFQNLNLSKDARETLEIIVSEISKVYLNSLGKEGLETMNSKGFLLQKDFNIDSQLLLIVGEVSEAKEFIRKHGSDEQVLRDMELKEGDGKPLHFPSELADIILRVTALASFLGIDLDKAVNEKKEYNKTRPYKHGKHESSNG